LATLGARALLDQSQRAFPPLVHQLESLFSNAHAPRIGIVHKDLWGTGVRVGQRRDSPNIVSIAHGQEGKHGDHRVLHGVQATGKVQALVQNGVARLLGQPKPESLRLIGLRRQIECMLCSCGPCELLALAVSQHLHRHANQPQVHWNGQIRA